MVRNAPRYILYFCYATVATVLILGAVAAALSSPNSKTIQYPPAVVSAFRAGEDALRAGRAEEAVADFQKALRLEPQFVEAKINLGLSYHLLGDYHQASAELAEGLRSRPDLPGPHLILGIDYLKLGLPSKAIPVLEEALRQDSANREAQETLAQCYLAQDDYGRALKHFQSAFLADPSHRAGAWFALGHDYLQMAKQLVDELSRIDQQAAWRIRLAGDLLNQRQSWGDATRQYEMALTRDPKQRGLHRALGEALLKSGKPDQARAAYQDELRLDAHNPQALLGLAETDLAEGKAPDALKKIDELAARSPRFLAQQTTFPSINLSPREASALIAQAESAPRDAAMDFLLSGLYRSLGKSAEAAKYRADFLAEVQKLSRRESATCANSSSDPCLAHRYASCIERLKNAGRLNSSQYLSLGRAYWALGQDGRAASAFASALDASGKARDPETLYWLVRCSMTLASQCFNRVSVAFPNSAFAYRLQAELDQLHGADEAAIRQYQQAERLQPDEPSIHEELGALYLKKHMLAEAKQELDRAIALDPTSGAAFYQLGRLSIATGQPQSGIAYLKKALQFDPGLMNAHASLGEAYLRAGDASRAAAELKEASSIDYYGDIHYLLYRAYQQLGDKLLAEQALARSNQLRRKTQAADQLRLSFAQP
jgi:tetratricopeptide (TPR) repeat protein